jgi:orotate phosphoribosyltransferase-like protein
MGKEYNKMIKFGLINEKRIVNLYKRGYGTDRISNKLNIGKTSVRKYLIKNKIKFRTPPKEVVSESLHHKIISLYDKELSMKEIAKKCHLSYASVNRHMHKENVELKKRGCPHQINKDAYKLTLEKAYILGVIGPGDGFIEDYNGCRIALESVDLDFINYFTYCLKKVYGIKPSLKHLKKREGDSKPHYKVRLYSVEGYKDILLYNADFKEKTWRVPKKIKEASARIKAKYLQGFADSQGSVSERSITLCNQNKEGLKEIIKLLNDIGIVNVRQGKNGLLLCSRKEVELFYKLVNFNIYYKKEKLGKVVNNYQVWKTPPDEITKIKPIIIELRKKGLSYPKIAESCNISVSTAWRHSNHFVINHVNQYF